MSMNIDFLPGAQHGVPVGTDLVQAPAWRQKRAAVVVVRRSRIGFGLSDWKAALHRESMTQNQAG
jgi:hypothetical protein